MLADAPEKAFLGTIHLTRVLHCYLLYNIIRRNWSEAPLVPWDFSSLNDCFPEMVCLSLVYVIVPYDWNEPEVRDGLDPHHQQLFNGTVRWLATPRQLHIIPYADYELSTALVLNQGLTALHAHRARWKFHVSIQDNFPLVVVVNAVG
jgi:hypothetical protein